MITRNEVRALLERVRDKVGFEIAHGIVLGEGDASHLIHVAESRFELMRDRALILLGEGAHIEIADSLRRAGVVLLDAFHALQATKQTTENAMSDAMKTLGDAVDGAVGEMNKAADFIKAHPAAQNDPALMDFANRLSAAATALAGVDTEVVATGTDTGGGTVDTGGTDTGGGTVSG